MALLGVLASILTLGFLQPGVSCFQNLALLKFFKPGGLGGAGRKLNECLHTPATAIWSRGGNFLGGRPPTLAGGESWQLELSWFFDKQMDVQQGPKKTF